MRATGALILLLAASVARAGDPPAPDSIANAKKDFATIKSLSSPSDASPVLPSLDMKDLGPSPGAHIDLPPPLADPDAVLDPSKKKEKEGTGNWLVDAMDRKDDRQRSSKGKDDLQKGDLDLLRDGDKAGAPDDRDSQASQDPREKPAGKEAAINPLDSFMAGWISARDHDLLLPAKSDGAAAIDAGRVHADALPDIDAGQPGLSESMLPSPEGSLWADSKAAPNPFIAAMDLDRAPEVRFFSAPEASLFAPAGTLGAPAAAGVDPRALDTGRTFIPDFAQPSDDDKYFKQMKKF